MILLMFFPNFTSIVLNFDIATGLHADVLSSYSWSANVTGRKRWYLIPPQFTLCLYDIFGTRIAPHLHYECDRYPGLLIAR